ncbi:hypothetical protein [Daejeonella sp.]|uniref:hypothetical protein n=1 Tax=Daejeonella sp. TaxID=2805397 RepID=UPI0039836A78
MTINLLLSIALKKLSLKIGSFILLGFGSLLWPISIIAVLWGIYDGFIPAIHKKEFEKAAVILFILLVTCIVIIVSLDKVVYLIAYIVPIILVYGYIKRYISPRQETIPDYRNN